MNVNFFLLDFFCSTFYFPMVFCIFLINNSMLHDSNTYKLLAMIISAIVSKVLLKVWEWSNFLLHCCAKLLGVFLPFTLWNKAFFMVSSFQFNVEFLSGIYGVAHFLKLWLFVQWFFSICVSGYLMFLIFFPSSLTFFPRFLKKKACITKMLVRDISFGHDVLLEFWIWEKHNCEIQLHGCWNVPIPGF